MHNILKCFLKALFSFEMASLLLRGVMIAIINNDGRMRLICGDINRNYGLTFIFLWRKLNRRTESSAPESFGWQEHFWGSVIYWHLSFLFLFQFNIRIKQQPSTRRLTLFTTIKTQESFRFYRNAPFC